MAHGTSRVTPSTVPGRTLTLTLDNTPAALRRVTSVLGAIPVTRLSYASTTSPRATARITVPSADADRARNKLDRLVEVLSVEVLPVEVLPVEVLPVEDTTWAGGSSPGLTPPSGRAPRR
ncbi:hypothetical protein [Streptomyces sp. NPDC047974]|uniref:hypothetical protein n=1 Tax=Streptomyces sp. NPDC047974 TaxID=3154343 RepID=UPI0033F1FE8E